jgi:hypothetical protein
VVVLLSTILLTALVLSLVMVTSGETMLTANYRHSQEALYAADAAVERVVQDILTVSQWNELISNGGNLQSSFTEGPTNVTLPDGTSIDVLRERDSLQAQSDATAVWGLNNPRWQLYAYGPLSAILPDGVDSPVYVAVCVADDPSENDGNPLIDGNGVLTLHAIAWVPEAAGRSSKPRSRGPPRRKSSGATSRSAARRNGTSAPARPRSRRRAPRSPR